jgi:hypothetical protein
MDRDILYGLVGSTLFLTLVGAFYLAPSKGRLAQTTAVAEAPSEMALEPGTPRQYSPEDVRFKFEQKAKKQGKRVVNPVADEPSPVPQNTDHEAPPIDDGGDETAEEPPLD